MKLYIASDHGGFELKSQLLSQDLSGFEWEDLGPQELNPDDDYPIYAFAVAEKVAFNLESGADVLGVLICRSGNGMAIAANKVKGIRAALCFSVRHAQMARKDDHANILVLDADYDGDDSADDILNAFVSTAVDSSERHIRRIGQITDYEQSH